MRVRSDGASAWLTVKGRSQGARRFEVETAIPVGEAQELLILCHRPLIEKTRYRIDNRDHTWEVDVFGGACQGLVLAEVELEAEDEEVELPDWIGQEVTDDPRFANSGLVAGRGQAPNGSSPSRNSSQISSGTAILPASAISSSQLQNWGTRSS